MTFFVIPQPCIPTEDNMESKELYRQYKTVAFVAGKYKIISL